MGIQLKYVLLSFLDPGIWVFEPGRAVQYFQMLLSVKKNLLRARPNAGYLKHNQI